MLYRERNNEQSLNYSALKVVWCLRPKTFDNATNIESGRLMDRSLFSGFNLKMTITIAIIRKISTSNWMETIIFI
jgi:hypothetical protein